MGWDIDPAAPYLVIWGGGESVAKPAPENHVGMACSNAGHDLKGVGRMRRLFSTKRGVAISAAVTTMLAASIGAYAYFTTTGAGSGSGTVGSSKALVIHQAGITYSNAATDNALVPGTTATVTFSVDNSSSANQQLGTISVSSITTDGAHAGCDTATNPTWFSTTTDAVGQDYAPGAGQVVPGSLTVTFNDVNVSQDVCKGAPLTFHYAA